MNTSHKEEVVHLNEIVLVSNEISKDMHGNIFNLSEDSYIFSGKDMLETVTEFSKAPGKLHIASTWVDMLRLAAWSFNPSRGDVFIILRNAGIRTEELLPFRDSDIMDIFPWLYYGKKLDVLRKICLTARINSEKHLKNKDVRVKCHLISEDSKQIVASSL